ncbi:MAG TPA: alpha/beta hydrolase [Phototrophicaceae bacterium]|nr:alpha/beta hydrolase [Phototrophicaceae bacterium]
MPFVTLPDSTRLYYETVGSGDPLILIAGQASDHHLWDGAADDYSAHYQVTVFDWRGTGQSDKPSEPPYSTRGFAKDVIGLMDALGIERAHAVGQSMGGRVGQWLGIDYPDRIGALVLGCTTPGNAHGVPRSPDFAMTLNSPDSPEKQMALAQFIYTPQWIYTHGAQLMEAERVMAENPVPPFAQMLHWQASEGHDAWELLPTIKAPTLVIHGSDDRLNATANAPLLAERIPNAELVIIPGGRHGFFLEFREQVSAAILDFLARHPLTSLAKA